MLTKFQVTVFFAFMLGSGSAFAAEGMVTIVSPANGAIVSSDKDTKLEFKQREAFEGLARLESVPVVKLVLEFETVPGPDGHHLQLNVDGKRVRNVYQWDGSIDIDPLPAGMHHICLAIDTKAQVLTGVESCIDVISKDVTAHSQ